ncbi:restriction endonuclease subunit S, partial [Candidatus Bipolaricaulota bacterium]|nr:restriction endonuclease subunit S [Candidatus Bipolaricaulota bacterium]
LERATRGSRGGSAVTWPNAEIGTLCSETATRDPRKQPGTEFRYIDISSVDRARKAVGATEIILGENAPSRARKEVRAGDVLVSTVRPNLNAVVEVESSLDGEIASTGFCVLRPRPDLLLSRYLFYFSQTRGFVDSLLASVRGAHYPAVSDRDVKQTTIPFAPLSEQRRIVRIMDQASEIRNLRADGNAIAGRVLSAHFIATFKDPTTSPKAWPACPIGELAIISTGNTPSRKKSEYYGDHIEWVKSDNLNTPSHYITPTAEHLSERGVKVGRTAPAGSTLVTCIAGSPGAIGNAALANRKVAFNQQINAATPKDGVDPYFLYAHFLVGKRLVQAASTGGMKGLVSKSRFSAIEFLSPPPEMQERFGRQCKELCDQNELRIRQSEQLDRLFAVLLHRAFSGDLTARWREAHMNELLQEMEEQARVLGLSDSEVTP